MKTTLYKIDNRNKIRFWTIEVSTNKYRTEYGEKDGKSVFTEWTTCEGKNIGKSNKTTPEEQAKLEAIAIVKKQREKGYGDVAAKPKNEVMLAKNYNDFKNKIGFPLYSQAKLDGIRCTVDRSMLTRNFKPIVSAPHILNQLLPLVEKHNITFDGELYNPLFKHDFNKICSLVKKQKPTKDDLQESEEKIQYWIYDIMDVTRTFSERQKLLRSIVTESDSIKLLSTELANNQDELDALYEKYLNEGNEGQIIRLDREYENKRSKNLLKRKEFQDEEFEIVSVNEGVGNKSQMAGNMTLIDKQGRIFNSNIKGSWEFLAECLNRADELVGKMATVQFFNYTPDNIPRFPYIIKIDRFDA